MKVTTDACLFGAWMANELAEMNGIEYCLDVGTGTGLLSLMAAQKNNDAVIDAVEMNPAAAEQAQENVAASPWPKRINVVRADVRQWQPQRKYNCVFANPPFYENDLRSPDDGRTSAHHDGGLKLPELLAFVGRHLLPNGVFFLLLPAKREAGFLALLPPFGLSASKLVRVRHSPGHRPFRLLVRGTKGVSAGQTQAEIVIRDGNGYYTPAFASLLREYYLHG